MAIGEVVADVREGLLAMAVGTGLQVMAAMMDADVTAVCGPKGKHDPDRARCGTAPRRGSVTLGGRRVPVERPRMRAVDGSGELPVPVLRVVHRHRGAGPDGDGQDAGRDLHPPLAGRAGTGRRAGRAGGDVDEQVRGQRAGSSRPPRPRWPTCSPRPLDELDLVALMLDGVHFGEHVCVVALGIGIDGTKHPLALVDGDTENTTVVTDLLVGLRERGLDTARPILVVIDGGEGAAGRGDAGVRPPGDRQVPAAQAAERRRPAARPARRTVGKRMRQAYHAESALAAEAQLEALAKELERTHPGAAASLREGLAETLTVLRLGVPPTLARTLRSTNSIESMICIARDHSRNVKNWQSGQHGAALVRRRHGRSRQAVPPRQRAPAPRRSPHALSTSMSPPKLSAPSVR